MQPRDYQTDCLTKTTKMLSGEDMRVLAVLATGLGKTIIFAMLAEIWHRENRGRVLVICPNIELVKQAADKIFQVTGRSPAIEQASNWSNECVDNEDYRSDFVVSCKASLVSAMPDGRKRYERFKDIGLVVVDEAHLAATSQYTAILDHFDCPTLGVTATPKRHDKVALRDIFDKCSYNYGIREAINDGWLVGCQTHCLQLQSLNLSQVSTANGDFVASQLGHVMEEDEVVFEVAEAVFNESGNDKTIVFTASVNQAEKVASVLCDVYGMKADFVCGDKARCSDDRRQDVLDSFRGDKAGIQVVCNVGVLSIGFDCPTLTHILLARPTKSLTWFTQCFGRGTRALEGVVDFQGSTPELRKQAISLSEKPFFRFTDLRDVSLKHKLITPIDVLGGKHSVAEQTIAKKLLEASDVHRDVNEVLEEAERLAREEEENLRRREAASRKAVEEALERLRLSRIHARSRFTKIAVDPFMAGLPAVTHEVTAHARSQGPIIMFGKYKSQPIATLPLGYLRYMNEKYGFHDARTRQAVHDRLGITSQGAT